ncbi:ricin-type beta-trefoil lectin domain protein [Streptomyces flavotricini]|uniref:Ricin-type beta-trefoil lectin domain protein n=1 Tax=Streptomyces flavotricini TaxID=66888 RepID=A0ABS8EHW0_9ACTN|nr:ricin-type beta-trefoil lectin domain protein [Streptomyces flavotricini]MCC0100720.1 ricin-type beta-trefoil lectin domain protein [Streptomyces flavotricini]
MQLDSQTVFWDVHAGSYGDNAYNDADNLLTAIANTTRQAGLAEWSALGDFNRNPDRLRALPTGTVAYRTNAGTQQGGGELDYMVSNGQNLNGWSGRALGGGVSDHFPVEFFFRAAAESATGDTPIRMAGDPTQCVTAVGAWKRVAASTCNGGAEQNWKFNNNGSVQTSAFGGQCLDISREGTSNATEVITFACNGQTNQNWQARGDGTLYNPQSGRCLDIGGVGSPAYPAIWDCNPDSSNQLFMTLSGVPQHEVAINSDSTISVNRINTFGAVDQTINLGGLSTRVAQLEEAGVLHIYRVGTDGRLWAGDLNVATDQWSGWSASVGGPGTPTNVTDIAVSAQNGTITLAAIDNMSHVAVSRRSQGSWNSWANFSNATAKRVAMVPVPGYFNEDTGSRVFDRMHFLTIGTDGHVYQDSSRIDSDGSLQGSSGATEIPGNIANASSLTGSLSGSSLTVEISNTSDYVYSQTMDTRRESDSQGTSWASSWTQVPNFRARNLTSESAPGVVRACGVSSDNRVTCAERDTHTNSVLPWVVGTLVTVAVIAVFAAIVYFFAPALPWVASTLAEAAPLIVHLKVL